MRKGITPVVAIVLLLLITVGAVGVVYTQFEAIVDQDPTDELGFLDDMDLRIQSVYSEDAGDGTMMVTLENNDEHEVDLTNATRLEYSVPGEQRVGPDQIDIVSNYGHDSGVNNHCLGEFEDGTDAETFGPGDRDSCDTGVDMPSPSEPVTIYLVQQGSGDVIDSRTCAPQTSDSVTC